MKKVITYGTYDLLHYGHIRLLERAKALGDYLIVGITSDDFDKNRGKINVQQSLMERVEAVKSTGIADEIIIEEYEGQKIDDIRRYDIDIFTVGSDWTGYFDYLKDYCEVVYLERTEGISSTELREKNYGIRLGLVGGSAVRILEKYFRESCLVNGVEVVGVYNNEIANESLPDLGVPIFNDYNQFICACEALYIVSHPSQHYEQIKTALENGKHVLCESPLTVSTKQTEELFALAEKKGVILMEAIKTAYATAYDRLLLIAQSGRIGRILSVDATCTSLDQEDNDGSDTEYSWNSICAWGPTAMLPVFQLLGTDYRNKTIVSSFLNTKTRWDGFSQISFLYDNAVGTIKVGTKVKSEGDLVISGTEGYIYVPSPWWKTDYFELRFEDQNNNKRYFYQLEGEGIRYELVAFIKSVKSGRSGAYIDRKITEKISEVIEDFYSGNTVIDIS